VSKYADMPEPPCGAIHRQYKECLVERRKWRAAQRRAGKLAPGTAARAWAVRAIYPEDDGRLVVGCVSGALSYDAARKLADRRRSDYSTHRYFEGYSVRLLRQAEESVAVVRAEACGAPSRATGMDLEWHGTPEDVYQPGASRSRRRTEGVPFLSGARRRRR
jgi:hypothetical protein